MLIYIVCYIFYIEDLNPLLELISVFLLQIAENNFFTLISNFTYIIQNDNSIAVWLLNMNGVQASGWSKFEDPTAVCTNISLEITKLGITFDFPPTKLKSV